jgi:hypothetical protein
MGNKIDKQHDYPIPVDGFDCSEGILNDIDNLTNSIRELLRNTSASSKLASAKFIAEIAAQILAATDQGVKDDACHDFKRRISFEILDGLLEKCSQGKCPVLDPAYHKCLIDISSEGYIRKRAYYYSDNKEASSKEKEDEDYYRAESRIQQIFSCPLAPKLNDELFEIDKNDLNNNPEHRRGAKRRKAFWRYLSRELAHKCGNHNTDYFDSCDFLKVITSDDPVNLDKTFYKDRLDMVSGLDLFRFCLARANSSHASAA